MEPTSRHLVRISDEAITGDINFPQGILQFKKCDQREAMIDRDGFGHRQYF
jgi:hypothetical protein